MASITRKKINSKQKRSNKFSSEEEKLNKKQEEKELTSQWEKAIRKRKEKIQLAFDLGWIAKQHNKLQSQNPYSDDDELMQEWFLGYQKFSKVKL